jgi:hypothetical protein
VLTRPIALALLLVAACSEAAPPLDELELRDALQASPSAITSLPIDARRSLASRLRDARQEQADTASVPSDPEAGEALEPDAVEAMILALDRSREDEGHDALVAAALDLAPPDARLLAPPARALALAQVDQASPPVVLEGADPSSPTSEAEARALAGEAGLILVDLAEQSGANRFVRVSGWPVGAVAAGRSVYVNATWLVAMASTEEAGPPAPSIEAPPFMTQTVPGNPYKPPSSLAVCVKEVTIDCEECVQSSLCGDSLVSDMDAHAACTFLREDPARFDQLCVLALLGMQSVAECVHERSPDCTVTSTDIVSSNLVAPISFLEGISCEATLDGCLAKANSGRSGGSSGGSSVCSVEGSGTTPGRKALLLFGPLLFVLFLGRLGRRGTWNAR